MHNVILNPKTRERALTLVEAAPDGYMVSIRPVTRSGQQNALMWQRLSEISQAKPEGRHHTPETWKALFMHACGHETRFENGLNGEPFPVGLRTSQLGVGEMNDLLEFIRAYADRHGVRLSE